MERITAYDELRKCYVIRPDAPQGEHVQRLGKYEDRDEAKEPVLKADSMICPVCGKGVEGVIINNENKVMPSLFGFCPGCGQRIKRRVKE